MKKTTGTFILVGSVFLVFIVLAMFELDLWEFAELIHEDGGLVLNVIMLALFVYGVGYVLGAVISNIRRWLK